MVCTDPPVTGRRRDRLAAPRSRWFETRGSMVSARSWGKRLRRGCGVSVVIAPHDTADAKTDGKVDQAQRHAVLQSTTRYERHHKLRGDCGCDQRSPDCPRNLLERCRVRRPSRSSNEANSSVTSDAGAINFHKCVNEDRFSSPQSKPHRDFVLWGSSINLIRLLMALAMRLESS